MAGEQEAVSLETNDLQNVSILSKKTREKSEPCLNRDFNLMTSVT